MSNDLQVVDQKLDRILELLLQMSERLAEIDRRTADLDAPLIGDEPG